MNMVRAGGLEGRRHSYHRCAHFMSTETLTLTVLVGEGDTSVCVWAPSGCQCWGQVRLELPLHLMPELPPLFSSSSFYRPLSLPFMFCRACSSSMSPLGLIDPRAKQTRTLGQTCGPYDHTWLHS